MADVFVGSGDTAPSDAELILGVRGGDLDAYGALYERHAAAARRLAVEYTRSGADAEDVVAEAFDRVLRVLQHGGGPDLTFRAYLFTVVRRLAGDLAGHARRTRPTDDDGTFEAALGVVGSSEDPTLVDFERSIVARAYRSLPERWQAVLWYTEVENLTPAEIAPMLGLSANGVSALAYRAREGLRVGYLQEHLTQDPADGCQVVNAHLGAFVRGALARRETAKVEEHLEGCGSCRALVLELSDVAHGMRAVVAPLVLGIAGLAALGSLPLGGALVGAAAVGTAATAGSAAGTAAAGTVTAGSAVVSTSATVGAGGAAAAVTSTAATAVTSTAVATGAAATGAIAAGATVASGVGLAVAAGAIAVATVGMVTALNGIHTTAPSDEPTAQVVAPLTAVGTNDIEKLAEASSPDAQDATSPANLLPALPPEVAPPAELALAVADRHILLEPRVAETVSFTVTNGGGHAAEQAFVRFDLPEGLEHAPAVSPLGASAAAHGLSAEMLPCTPAGEGSRHVSCSLGTLEPGESRTVAVTVVARHGGEYLINATAWSEEVEPTPVPITAAVRYYGPELTARTGETAFVENPGEAVVPVTVHNSGDRPAEQWSVVVAVPGGLAPVGTGGLVCEPGDAGWTCSLPAGAGTLEPGEVWAADLRVVADGETPDGETSAAVVPVLPGSDHVVQAEASFDVDVAWDDAPVGVGPLRAVCAKTGGAGAADTVVEATYTNALPRAVTVRLDAAGATSQAYTLERGESRTVRLHDGLRVPAGGGTWTVTTVVAGTPYSTTVAAGTHGARDCYAPAWDVTTSATTANAGGTVRIDGTVTNDSPEPLRVGMQAAGRSAAPVQVGPGESVVLSVETGQAAVGAGEASFGLYRWVTDSDGDEPEHGLSVQGPAAPYGAATIAPRVEASAASAVRECRYDAGADASRRTFDIALDNTASTLPVTFALTVAGVEHTTKVPAGAVGSLAAVEVPWGTEQLEVRADGRPIGVVDVGFESCAEVTWPVTTVAATTSMRCVADSARVVAGVVNKGSTAWVATLVRDGREGEPVTVQPGAAGRVRLDLGTMVAPPGTVELRLERTHEGLRQTVEGALQHDGKSCVVVAPQTRLVEGDVEVTGDSWSDRASTRTVGIVLDNSASNVPVDFRVAGPGVDTTVTVGARTTETFDGGVVQGRDGATFHVAAGGRTSDLVVEQFTGMASWCGPDVRAGRLAVGDVVSWEGVNYRLVVVPAAVTAELELPTGPGEGQALADALGQARRGDGEAEAAPGGEPVGWEIVSECEYR